MRRLQLVHSASRARAEVTTGVSVTHARSTTAAHAAVTGDADVDPLVQKLLEHVRIIAPLPRLVRARALARARAAIDDVPTARRSRG